VTAHAVLLVDDQAIVGETVRSMLAGAPDLELHVCLDPTQALATAARLRQYVILQNDLLMPASMGSSPATRDIFVVVRSFTDDAPWLERRRRAPLRRAPAITS